jgi:hypothetical protein
VATRLASDLVEAEERAKEERAAPLVADFASSAVPRTSNPPRFAVAGSRLCGSLQTQCLSPIGTCGVRYGLGRILGAWRRSFRSGLPSRG